MLVAGVVLAVLVYRQLTGDGSVPVVAAVNGAEVAALRDELAELGRRHERTAARLAELEASLGGADDGSPRQPREPAVEVGEGEADAAGILAATPAPSRGEKNSERIEEAGLTVEEFRGIEAQAYALHLESVETDWERRRERYLSEERPATSSEQLRESLGDDAYDRYLYASGRANRVRLRQVLPGSAAEAAGLVPGDVVLSYGDQRIFGFDDLRRASYEGEPGELVVLEVQKADGSLSQSVMTRGPLGLSGYRGWRETPGQ